jgi:hypothetical protein
VAVRPADRESVEQPRQRCRRHVPGCHRGGLRGAWYDGSRRAGLDARPSRHHRRFELELSRRTPTRGQFQPDNDDYILFISVRGARPGDNDNSLVDHHLDGIERYFDNFASSNAFAIYDNHQSFANDNNYESVVDHHDHETSDYHDDDKTIDYHDDDKTIDYHHDHDEAAAHHDNDEAAAHDDNDEAATHNDDNILHFDYLSVVLMLCGRAVAAQALTNENDNN